MREEGIGRTHSEVGALLGLRGLPNHLFVNNIYCIGTFSLAIDHRMRSAGLPVRSVVLKPHAGIVVGFVRTSEPLLLIVF